MGALTVAAAQAVSARGDVKANLDQHCRLAELAADAGTSVTVFPELSLTGYEPGIAAALAFSAEDERLKPLVDLADSRKVTLVVRWAISVLPYGPPNIETATARISA